MAVTLEQKGDVALITMDDGKVNAISHAMLDGLHKALDDSKDAKAVVLAGRAGIFSGGFDLSVLQSGDMLAAMELVRAGGLLTHRIYGLGKPVVAAATGHAIAMGSFLLMSFDSRIGPDGPAKYGMNESAIGMVIPMFAQVLTEERIALRHRTKAFIQATLYDSKGAVEAGYLDRLVAPEQVVEAALEEAAALAVYPTSAYAGNKAQIRQPALDRMKKSLDV